MVEPRGAGMVLITLRASGEVRADAFEKGDAEIDPDMVAIAGSSGSTTVGGLLVGLRHEDAARFSFLLATPIIIGAAVLEIPKLLHGPTETGSAVLSGNVLWIAGLAAGLTAYASTAFLMRYFRTHEESAALDPFAYYCWLAGVSALAILHWASR